MNGEPIFYLLKSLYNLLIKEERSKEIRYTSVTETQEMPGGPYKRSLYPSFSLISPLPLTTLSTIPFPFPFSRVGDGGVEREEKGGEIQRERKGDLMLFL